MPPLLLSMGNLANFVSCRGLPCLPSSPGISPSYILFLTNLCTSPSPSLSLLPRPLSLSLQGRNHYAAGVVAQTQRPISQSFLVLAKSTMSSGKESPDDMVIMVDPLEAKRLASKKIEDSCAKLKFKRQCRIEAANGAWAIVGLTVGLVIEGQTGNSIVSQLSGYWGAVTIFLQKLIPL